MDTEVRERYLAHVHEDASTLLAAAHGRLGTDVPTCPGWSLERLVGHVGRVYRWTAGWVTSGGNQDVEPAPAGEAVLDWTAAGRDHLVACLQDAERSGTVSTWAGEQPAVFWPRRMALETALHRWDAQVSVGPPEAIDASLARDGVDEAFDVILPQRRRDELQALQADGASLHLHATDVAGEWLVRFVPPPQLLEVERSHAKGDAAVRAPASDLLLLLWNRVPHTVLDTFGDKDLLDRWTEHVKMA
jgi:uncharacterized protein (TIGR03083 family)